MALPDRDHDLRLPVWGPYSKRYAGISHLPDLDSGVRWDVAVAPGFYRRSVLVPNVLWESGWAATAAAPGLEAYAYRFHLDQRGVFVDAIFGELSSGSRLVRCELVNQTDEPQNLVLHLLAGLELPTPRLGPVHVDRAGGGDAPLRPPRAVCATGAVWVAALDYRDIRFGKAHHQDRLVPDLLRRGEVLDFTCVGGRGLGRGWMRGFGADGDEVEWDLPAGEAMVLRLRCRLPVGRSVRVEQVSGTASTTIVGQDGTSFTDLSLGRWPGGRLTLRFTGDADLLFDGFFAGPAAAVRACAVVADERGLQAQIAEGPLPASRVLTYADAPGTVYGIAWDFADHEVREFHCADLDSTLRRTVHNHTARSFRGPGQGHWLDVFLRPIPVAPGGRRVVTAVLAQGTEASVTQALRAIADVPALDRAQARSVAAMVDLRGNPAGEAVRPGAQALAATLLTNVVYPLTCRGSWVRHFTPGRAWDSWYTWDSGFIGLGLAEIDVERAIDCLCAYLCPPGDPHAAFCHHGSPMPVQFLLAQDLWNRTRDRDLLAHVVPRLVQYHRFLMGRLGGSTTRTLASGLIRTWDYFYNSGGWDDYPPQKRVHAEGLAAATAPAISSSMVARCGRILAGFARILGREGEATEFERDASELVAALEAHAWDEAAGIYGYVRHDAAGHPCGLLRDATGVNANLGLDGTSPLLAGGIDPGRASRLIASLGDERRFLTPVGVSTVDRTAPYYRHDGYWNGAVWMPHQWFVWKALLDWGEGALAHRIAGIALRTWQTEVERTGFCWEHFMIESGRGAGWHQFGGLSAPVVAWFGAYHRPWRLTGGFDCWILDHQETAGGAHWSLRLDGRRDGMATVVVAASETGRWQATWRGAPVPARPVLGGALGISLPRDGAEGELRILPA